MTDNQIVLITGTSKGIGKYLVQHYAEKGCTVIGCSRRPVDYQAKNYMHFCLDVADEAKVKQMFTEVRKTYGKLHVLINNAGIASMNHALLTPLSTIHNVLNTNVVGTYLFCREAARLMKKAKYGRIVNFATVAVPLKLEGESIYAASKAAVVSLTEVLARELADLGITVNAVGPTPVKTDLIRAVPEDKLNALLDRQALKRFGEFEDISNVIDFLVRPQSDFITGQVIYLGGV